MDQECRGWETHQTLTMNAKMVYTHIEKRHNNRPKKYYRIWNMDKAPMIMKDNHDYEKIPTIMKKNTTIRTKYTHDKNTPPLIFFVLWTTFTKIIMMLHV